MITKNESACVESALIMSTGRASGGGADQVTTSALSKRLNTAGAGTY